MEQPRPHSFGTGWIVTLLNALLLFYLGRAHLGMTYTPHLLDAVYGRQAECAAKAFWWFGFEAQDIRKYLGYFSILVGNLLLIPRTSQFAQYSAAGYTYLGIYSAWYNSHPIIPQGIILGIQIVGLMIQ